MRQVNRRVTKSMTSSVARGRVQEEGGRCADAQTAQTDGALPHEITSMECNSHFVRGCGQVPGSTLGQDDGWNGCGGADRDQDPGDRAPSSCWNAISDKQPDAERERRARADDEAEQCRLELENHGASSLLHANTVLISMMDVDRHRARHGVCELQLVEAPSIMKATLLHEHDGLRTFVLVLATDDEAISVLTAFAAEERLSASHFTAIGAFSHAVVAYFDWSSKRYQHISIEEQVEVLSLVGDIALEKDQPKVHAHVVVGKVNATAHGGHLVEGHVRPTLEVVVTEAPVYLRRRFDAESGLALIDPSLT
jgi:uncharacterized protein